MNTKLYKPLIAIFIIVIAYSFNKTLGYGLFILAVLAMLKTYYSNRS